MESSQWENGTNLFCCKVSFLKQTYLYLWYPLFEVQWDRKSRIIPYIVALDLFVMQNKKNKKYINI